jgi:hypothetical protein
MPMMQRIELKYLKDAPKPVLEVYQKLKTFMEAKARREWEDRRKKCWDAIENKIWTPEEEAEIKKFGQIPLTINKCNKGVQGSSAIVTDSKPEVKFHPVGGGDLYVAELMKRAFDYVWARNNGNDITYELVEETKIGGCGFFDVHHDPAKGMFGRIDIEESPPDDIYYDAESRKRDYSDTDIFKAKLRTKTYIKENYPNEKFTDEELVFQQALKKDTDEETSEGLTGKDNYAEGKKDYIPGVDPEPKCVWEIEAWLKKVVTEYRLVTYAENGTIASSEALDEKPEDIRPDQELYTLTVEKREQRIIVGQKLIESKMNPYGVDADGDPVMPIIGLKAQRTRSAYPMSPTAYAIQINKEKCKRRQQFIAAASQEINSPLIEEEGTKWDGRPGNPGSRAIISKTAATKPHRMNVGSMNMGSFITLEDKADADIDDQYDLQDVMRGKTPKGHENASGRLVLALQDLGGMMSKPFLRNLEAALVRMAKVVCSIILETWPREMWERLLDKEDMTKWTPDGQAEEPDELIAEKWAAALEAVSPEDPTQKTNLSLMNFDIRLTAGSSMPTNRMAKMQLGMEMFEAGVYDREAVLSMIDDPDKDKIIKRMKEQEQMMMEQEAMKG